MFHDHKRPPPSSQHWLSRLVHGELPLEHETALFILVNVLDFFMTFLLLWTGDFREQNPIAAYFLHRWGPVKGMLAFKLILVATICIISQIVATQRLEVARWLLYFGTAVVAGVVIYSLMLFLRVL